MKVAVRYFASIREALGASQAIEVGESITLGSLRDLLIASSAVHAEALGRGKALRVALDRALSDETATLHEGAEVAFFPPVTGG